MRFYEVSFANEAPTIGSGRRYVFAVAGPAWVRLLTPRLEIARVRRAKWDVVRKAEIDLDADPERRRRLRNILRKNARWRRRTNLVKRAESMLNRRS